MRYFVFLLLLSLSVSAAAKWRIINKVDVFTDEKIRYAEYDGSFHLLRFKREKDNGRNGVWMYIFRKESGGIEPNTDIDLRVDKKKAHKISHNSPGFIWDGSAVGFSIWHGDPKKGCGFIGEMMSGGILKFRYWTSKFRQELHTSSLFDENTKEILMKTFNIDKC